jgi:phage terminase large subunit
MRQWIRTGGCVWDHQDLERQLTSRQYGFDAHNRITLEKKADMKKRGLASPDIADALALTFAYPVAPRGASPRGVGGGEVVSDYNPYASADA